MYRLGAPLLFWQFYPQIYVYQAGGDGTIGWGEQWGGAVAKHQGKVQVQGNACTLTSNETGYSMWCMHDAM